MTMPESDNPVPTCQGSCEHHSDDVFRVRVRHLRTGHDWGEFWYCRAAIEEDRRRGLYVEESEANHA